MGKSRFALFMGEHYYPSGGWGDFVASFDTIEEARRSLELALKEDQKHAVRRFEWWEIVDLHKAKRIYECYHISKTYDWYESAGLLVNHTG